MRLSLILASVAIVASSAVLAAPGRTPNQAEMEEMEQYLQHLQEKYPDLAENEENGFVVDDEELPAANKETSIVQDGKIAPNKTLTSLNETDIKSVLAKIEFIDTLTLGTNSSSLDSEEIHAMVANCTQEQEALTAAAEECLFKNGTQAFECVCEPETLKTVEPLLECYNKANTTVVPPTFKTIENACKAKVADDDAFLAKVTSGAGLIKAGLWTVLTVGAVAFTLI